MIYLIRLRGRLAKSPLHHVVWVRGYGSIAPQPSHHVWHDRPTEFLAVQVYAPRVVHVITLLRESLHQPHILQEPVELLVVDAVAGAAIIVPPVAQEYPDRLLLTR